MLLKRFLLIIILISSYLLVGCSVKNYDGKLRLDKQIATVIHVNNILVNDI